ncbi:MAG TPA: ferredoxin-thioredoxin reductase catalytic domain-containing protein [Candidatus Brocadiia bacterium]|nr:ferredoxin-thioredoxin reductase catalytic domain-containing protein [Candidatus Brocadiia bacterium]
MKDAHEGGALEQAELDALRRHVAGEASRRGLKLNPDAKTVEGVLRGLLKRRTRYGELYCPCRVASGDRAKDKDIICPCVFCEKEVAERGICHCRLLVADKPGA